MHALVRRKLTASEQEAFGDKLSMLRQGEPELDPWWPVSSAPPDHRLPPLLHLPCEFRVSRMWNDGGFPFPSSPFTISFAGNSESRTRISNASAELEGQYGTGIFTTPQGCDSFQFGIFPPPLTPAAGLSTTLNSNPGMVLDGAGDGDVLMVTTTTTTNPKSSSMAQIQPDNVAGWNKLMTSSDRRSKRITSARASKRLRTLENLHQPPCDEAAAIHPQMMKKAPVRRSQKLGDKITALQQLVSPFGKTDTASVLHEATLCIKYLHEQIQVLTASYFRIKSSPHLQGHGGERSGLRSRGLCLAPISSTIISLINQQANSSRSPERATMATTARFY